jgi:hypothetical protein
MTAIRNPCFGEGTRMRVMGLMNGGIARGLLSITSFSNGLQQLNHLRLCALGIVIPLGESQVAYFISKFSDNFMLFTCIAGLLYCPN